MGMQHTDAAGFLCFILHLGFIPANLTCFRMIVVSCLPCRTAKYKLKNKNIIVVDVSFLWAHVFRTSCYQLKSSYNQLSGVEEFMA
jgi:hypothetical protein